MIHLIPGSVSRSDKVLHPRRWQLDCQRIHDVRSGRTTDNTTLHDAANFNQRAAKGQNPESLILRTLLGDGLSSVSVYRRFGSNQNTVLQWAESLEIRNQNHNSRG